MKMTGMPPTLPAGFKLVLFLHIPNFLIDWFLSHIFILDHLLHTHTPESNQFIYLFTYLFILVNEA